MSVLSSVFLDLQGTPVLSGGVSPSFSYYSHLQRFFPLPCQPASARLVGGGNNSNSLARLHIISLTRPVLTTDSSQLHRHFRRCEDRYDTHVGSEEF